MTDRDLTPAEARAEVEAFMGEGWVIRVQSSEYMHVWAYAGMCCVEGHEPTFRAAVDALKQAWRDAVRPWCIASTVPSAESPFVKVARILGEDNK